MDASGPPPQGVLPVPPVEFVGPILIGILFCYLLYGVVLVLVGQYVQYVAPKDKPMLKWLVAAVLGVLTLQLAFLTENAWRVCVLGFLHPMNLIIPPATAPATGILNGFISGSVQLFFAWRILTLGSKTAFAWVACSAVLVCALLQFAGATGITIQFALLNRDVLQMHKLKNYIIIHLTGSVACDLLITGSMVYILLIYKGNTAFGKTKSLLNTLILHTIENGLITTAAAIANLAVYFLRTQDASNIAFQYIIGGLYAIVLLTALNRRQGVRRRGEGPTSFSLSDGENFSRSSRANHATSPHVVSSHSRSRPPFQVSVVRTTDHDGGSDYDATSERKDRVEPEGYGRDTGFGGKESFVKM